MLDGFVSDLGTRPHDYDHALGIGCTHVIHQVIGTAHYRRELVHHRLDGLWTSLVVRVGPLAHLEEHVGILSGAAQNWTIGRESALTMLENAIRVDEGAHIVFREHF